MNLLRDIEQTKIDIIFFLLQSKEQTKIVQIRKKNTKKKQTTKLFTLQNTQWDIFSSNET